MLQNQGGFGGNTQDNPKNETCNRITLRSREVSERQVVEKPIRKKVDEGEVEKERNDDVVEKMANEGEVENENLPNEVEVSDDEEGEVEKVPYPRKKRVNNLECEKEFKKFMKVLNKLEMAIPLVEALEQMPSYTKFLKELLTKKRKPLNDEMVSMTEECSALIQRKLPQKKKDPGSFTIPCSIGNLTIADFVVLDLEEDKNWEPLLLGRPFLATERALIDVELGELMLRTDGEQILFNVFEAMKKHDDDPQCFRVEMVDEVIEDVLKVQNCSSPLEKVLVNSIDSMEEEWEAEIKLCLNNLNATRVDENPKVENIYEVNTSDGKKEERVQIGW
ncbi:unnamed protein product [Trifolium pratense]|uniref:Uncharacterized protein n=1 Tax=Trifolium pratense TaxID=57577 RepID=A0ACB0JJ23_TRIPR|nr:unnamed protein product [Trifolium pratense]